MKCFDPKIDRIMSLGSKQYLLNDKFYVKNFFDWDEQLRDWLASQEKVVLGEEHYFAIQCLRNYYSQMMVHPVVRTITLELQKQFGNEKGNVKYFHSLFPGGIHQAFLIAGLPMVDSCC
jgi:TusE/DsrC/DsvC family sulfur relay protein